MKSLKVFLISGVTVLAACGQDLQVPNYNAQSVSELEDAPTAASISIGVIGLLGISREFNTSILQSHVASAGTFGREGMELDPSNPSHPVDKLEQIGPGEGGYAGFSIAYRLIKQANIVLKAVDKVAALSEQQKAGVKGIAKTLQALAFMRLHVSFYDSGFPIDVDVSPNDPIPPVATRAQGEARIAQLLDEGATQLAAAGTSFPFALPTGFAGFNTPPTFLKFNRALKARAAIHAKNWAGALTALNTSFIDKNVSLKTGVYDTYRNAGDNRPNPLFDPTCRALFAQPEVETKAQKQPGGQLDQRYLDKILKFTTKRVHLIDVSLCFLPLYPSADSPVPIIRNEELFLIRAEANLMLGNRALALDDINFIRTTSGKLAPIADPGGDALLDELLYNRWYSLMWEAGHRLADMRRHNRLGTLQKVLANHKVFPYLPLPSTECTPRTPQPDACKSPAGI